jgi:glycogen debranching enzyme
LKEVPFGPYYGTIDASPLTLLLIDDVIGWSGDDDYARRIWPKVERILAYLDREVADGAGYLRYGGDKGLANQGWKDSGDSIMYENGELAKAPIALCEPQGYLYSAWCRMAVLADRLGHAGTAQALRDKAADLQIRFQRDFWMQEKQFVALALDGNNVQCQVISSNPGHIFACGILTDEQAEQVATRLMQSDMFCGWGIRTLSSEEQRYNPLSYHNGSVWPHDNSMAARQMADRGLTDSVCQVFEALFAVAVTQPDLRLPELFAGTQRSSKVPVRYIVSCIPQAWAAGSMLQLLQSSLGLTADAPGKTLRVSNPSVPASLGTVTVTNLHVGDATVDLQFANLDGRTSCVVTGQRGELHVIVES